MALSFAPSLFGAVGAAAQSQLAAAVLPSSRAGVTGSPLTVFATIINAGSNTATSCTVDLATAMPIDLDFQTTEPEANTLIGSPNTPVDIPAGGSQSFVVTVTPTTAFTSTDIALSFDCANRVPAIVQPGLNTLLLLASDDPVPDIVAVAATLGHDGIVDIAGLTETGAFAVATTNVGSAATITATAEPSDGSLPVQVAICETIPDTGECMAPPGNSVTTDIAAFATPTFGVFVTGNATVPFDPANNRVVVSFKDTHGVIVGRTSVAARTQPTPGLFIETFDAVRSGATNFTGAGGVVFAGGAVRPPPDPIFANTGRLAYRVQGTVTVTLPRPADQISVYANGSNGNRLSMLVTGSRGTSRSSQVGGPNTFTVDGSGPGGVGNIQTLTFTSNDGWIDTVTWRESD